MKNVARMIKTAVVTGALSLGALHSAQAWAALSIADYPLFMGVQASPNIMFLLDDSGSMHWEYMPDDLNSGLSYQTFMYPQPEDVYGNGDYTIACSNSPRRYFVPTFSDTNIQNLKFRSSNFNKAYYNPDITYQPWSQSDGTQMANAVPTGAYYNPANTALGSMNLTQSQTMKAHWYQQGTSGGWAWVNFSCDGAQQTFWPITYYKYNSGNVNSVASYTKVQITTSTSASATFTSPSGIVRTKAQETQNFANWFTYYRSRLLASRGGIGRAFASQSDGLRVGFGTINQGTTTVDGVSSKSVIRGVRSFAGADRSQFYTLLYERDVPPASTPLRKALDDAGQYYSRSDNKGPWGSIPGTNDSTAHLECRKSYTILMTDGYWSEGSSSYEAATAGARADNENSNGPVHGNPDSNNSINNSAGSPITGYTTAGTFTDGRANTLADVAMYYWKNDLRTNLQNKVPVRKAKAAPEDIANPAYWQHMVTFGVGLGVTGSQDPTAAFQAVKDGTSINWVSPFGNNNGKLDDLLHAAVNSRGGFFSAADPDEFATKLTNVLDNIASQDSSSSSAVANTTRLDTDTLVYQAKFSPINWSGQLLAFTVPPTGIVDTDNPVWDADDELPSHANRKILSTKPGTGGITFNWTQLSTAQKNLLHKDAFGVTDNAGEARLNYLRGDTSQTGPASDPFRSRVTVGANDADGFDLLGDIVNSDPIFVGTGDFGYGRPTSGMTTTEKSAYNTFRSQTSYINRKKMIYIGANDGMMHGFDAQTGKELFAYVPNALFPKLSALTSDSYSHDYYVDATPHMGDAYINNNWKTVVTSTLGAGGRAIFAIDATDPGSVGAGDVMWEVEADDNDNTLKHMGYMLGKPQIVRVYAQDKWVALVGNGYNSADHKAVLFVIDVKDGSVIKAIDTGVGSAAAPNGLGTPLAADLNSDRIVDTVYAGDLHGNLWKFDLSGNVNQWDVAIKQGNNLKPLYQACDGASCTATNMQPITTQPTIAPNTDAGGVMVLFGTGQYFTNSDAQVSASPRTEAFYGIYDCGAQSNSNCGDTVTRSELVQQSIILEDDRGTTDLGDDIRVTSDLDVTISNSVKGWFLELIPPAASDGGGERVVANPILVNNVVLFVTFVPDSNPCNFGGSSWLMEINPTTGARMPHPVLDSNNDGVIDEFDVVSAPGVTGQVGISGKRSAEKQSTPGILHGAGSDGTTVLKIFSGSSGNIDIEINSGVNKAGRQSWRQLR